MKPQSTIERQATRKIKKNDQVVVLVGRDRDKRGKVLKVIPEKGRAIVERIAFVKRHTRPNPQKNIKGGIAERESAIPLSNLMVICPECGEPTRIGKKILEDGRRVRVCKKCKGVVDRSK